MDQNIKNRLVGIIVIFALAVVFLPMILDGSGVRKDKFEVVIPPSPVVEANPEFDTRIIELNAEAEAIPELEQRFVDEVSSPEQVKPAAATKEIPVEEKADSEVAKAPAPRPPQLNRPRLVAIAGYCRLAVIRSVKKHWCSVINCENPMSPLFLLSSSMSIRNPVIVCAWDLSSIVSRLAWRRTRSRPSMTLMA